MPPRMSRIELKEREPTTFDVFPQMLSATTRAAFDREVAREVRRSVAAVEERHKREFARAVETAVQKRLDALTVKQRIAHAIDRKMLPIERAAMRERVRCSKLPASVDARRFVAWAAECLAPADVGLIVGVLDKFDTKGSQR